MPRFTVSRDVRATATDTWTTLVDWPRHGDWVPLTVMFLLTGSLAMMNDGLRDAFDPSSSSTGKAGKAATRKARAGKKTPA